MRQYNSTIQWLYEQIPPYQFKGKIVNVKIEKTNRNTLFGRIDKSKSMRAA